MLKTSTPTHTKHERPRSHRIASLLLFFVAAALLVYAISWMLYNPASDLIQSQTRSGCVSTGQSCSVAAPYVIAMTDLSNARFMTVAAFLVTAGSAVLSISFAVRRKLKLFTLLASWLIVFSGLWLIGSAISLVLPAYESSASSSAQARLAWLALVLSLPTATFYAYMRMHRFTTNDALRRLSAKTKRATYKKPSK